MVVGVLLSLPLHVGLLFVSLAMLTEAVEVEHASSDFRMVGLVAGGSSGVKSSPPCENMMTHLHAHPPRRKNFRRDVEGPLSKASITTSIDRQKNCN